MKHVFQRLEAKYAGLNRRERMLIAAVFLIVLYALWDTALLGPELRHQKHIYAEIQDLSKQIENVDGVLDAAAKRLDGSEEARMRARIDDLTKQIDRAAKQEHEMVSRFVPPDQVPQLLQDLLKSQAGLRLVKLENLPVIRLPGLNEEGRNTSSPTASDPGTPETARTEIYQHGVRLTVEGRYFDIQRYLKAAEAMPWQIYWDQLDYKVQNYPRASATITAHTLSLKEEWIGA